MAKFTIRSVGTNEWKVEAANYRLESDFFHFYSFAGDQLFAVRADHVKTIRADEADQE